MKKEQCKHKWIPNGMVTKEVWECLSSNAKIGEKVYASAICEKCGEIKIKEL